MRRSLALLGFVTVGGVGAASACSSSSTPSPLAGDAGTDTGASSFTLEVPCTDTMDSIYAAPGALPSDKGAIIRCAPDKAISKADLLAAASLDHGSDVGYKGKPFTSGAKVFRVLYRTERGDAAGSAGYSSATVYVPDTPRAAQLPVLVYSHGSRGQAARCAPSKLDPTAAYTDSDYFHNVYPLIGSGYVVIAPDLAGYANYGAAGNPPSAYASAKDVGKSTLDGARALRKMFKSSVSDKVVLTGHSQGGGTALAALALSETYGADGTIAAVAVFAPLWLPARAYGAILQAPASYQVKSSAPPMVSMWYHYTTSELLDGPGHGIDIFQASKQAIVKSFVDNDCWTDHYLDLEAAATTTGAANDFYDPVFTNAIKAAAAGLGGGDCNGNALCQKWIDRYNKERPHLTGNAAKVPILLSWGGKDTTMSPDLMSCVFDRLKADNVNYKVCYDPASGHSSIVALQADRVNDWIAGKTIAGATEPANCALDETAAKDDGGNLFACNPLIVNNQD